MKYMSPDTFADVITFTRKEKLLRWANLVREDTKINSSLMVFYDLEHLTLAELRRLPIHHTQAQNNVFGIATKDPVFQSLGLAADAPISDIVNFLEINRHELHAVSCGCHTAMDRHEVVAQRIEQLANKA
jgi:hypothetical protein